MAGTEAKKIAPATNNRAQKKAARLTGRRSFHAQAYSPYRRITPAPPGSLTHPSARWRHSYSIRLRPPPAVPSPAVTTCRPYKFLVNLRRNAISHKELLGVASAIFLFGLMRRGARWQRSPALPKSQVTAAPTIYGFCLKSDADAPIEAPCAHMPGGAVTSEHSNASEE